MEVGVYLACLNQLCKHGRILRLLARLHVTKLTDATSPAEHVSVQYVQSRCPVRVSRDVIYSALRSSGFQYGDTFSLLDHAYTNSTECLAVLQVPKVSQQVACISVVQAESARSLSLQQGGRIV